MRKKTEAEIREKEIHKVIERLQNPPEFKTEAHQKNFEGVMRHRIEQLKKPMDLEKALNDLKRNSKDYPL